MQRLRNNARLIIINLPMQQLSPALDEIQELQQPATPTTPLQPKMRGHPLSCRKYEPLQSYLAPQPSLPPAKFCNQKLKDKVVFPAQTNICFTYAGGARGPPRKGTAKSQATRKNKTSQDTSFNLSIYKYLGQKAKMVEAEKGTQKYELFRQEFSLTDGTKICDSRLVSSSLSQRHQKLKQNSVRKKASSAQKTNNATVTKVSISRMIQNSIEGRNSSPTENLYGRNVGRGCPTKTYKIEIQKSLGASLNVFEHRQKRHSFGLWGLKDENSLNMDCGYSRYKKSKSQKSEQFLFSHIVAKAASANRAKVREKAKSNKLSLNIPGRWEVDFLASQSKTLELLNQQ